MPEEFHRPDLGAPGAQTGHTVEGTSSGPGLIGKTVTWVVERRYFNEYRHEPGAVPEGVERTGNRREATDETLCGKAGGSVTCVLHGTEAKVIERPSCVPAR